MTFGNRRPRRAVLPFAAVASALAVGIGISASVGAAADPRLDTADASLQQAAALLDASLPGEVSEQQRKRFEKEVSNAIDHIARARSAIAEAKAAVDNP